MMPLRRQPAPDFWGEKEKKFLAKLSERAKSVASRGRTKRPSKARPAGRAKGSAGGRSDEKEPLAKGLFHRWKHERRTLAEWFHDGVRPSGEPRLCSYCDARLEESSPSTIDHFIPEHVSPELGLSWPNLYPACMRCNAYKGAQWSDRLLRPDVDLAPRTPNEPELVAFDRCFSFDPEDGTLSPSPGAGPKTQERVKKTIEVFRLNEPTRCIARRNRWRELLNVAKPPPDDGYLAEMVNQGPYRFVARLFLASRAQPSAGPDGSP